MEKSRNRMERTMYAGRGGYSRLDVCNQEYMLSAAAAGCLNIKLAVMTAVADMSGTFPRSPIQGSALLVPITSWSEMHEETKATKVEFDLFWYNSVIDGVAYFFRWLGEPRSTVLVVWNDKGPTHIECRTERDLLVSPHDSAGISAAVTAAFRAAGYWQHMAEH